MSLENFDKKPKSKIAEILTAEECTVEDDFSYFCKFDDLAEITDSQRTESNNESDSNEKQGLSEAKGSLLIDKFVVEDDFSYFCMYDDLMGYENIPVEEEQEEVSEQSLDESMPWWKKKLTSSEYAQGLEILFGALFQLEIKNNTGRYFKGEITPNELVTNVNEEGIHYIHRLINRVLNYKCKNIRYYISLPVDMFFNTNDAGHFILACKLDESFKNIEMSTLIGPTDFKYDVSVIKSYLEIDGDFSQIPSGAELALYDYLQIVKKHPDIIEHLSQLMKTDCVFSHYYEDKSEEEMRQLALEHLQKWLKSYPKPDEDTSKFEKQDGSMALSQETIDSITFVQPIEYVTLEEIKNGTFGTFEEILERISDKQNESVLKMKL